MIYPTPKVLVVAVAGHNQLPPTGINSLAYVIIGEIMGHAPEETSAHGRQLTMVPLVRHHQRNQGLKAQRAKAKAKGKTMAKAKAKTTQKDPDLKAQRAKAMTKAKKKEDTNKALQRLGK